MFERFIKKACVEYEKFINDLKVCPAEEVVKKTYEICFKRQILDLLQNGDLTDGQYVSLMTLDKPLDALYQDWVSCKDPHLDMIENVINDFSSDLEKSLYSSSSKTVQKQIGAYLVEQEKDLGNGDSLCLCYCEGADYSPYMVCKFNFDMASMPTSVFTTKSHSEAKSSFEIRSKNAEKGTRQKESELEL